MKPARQGTTNVLTAAARNKTNLKRVIVTSSVAAVKDTKALTPKSGGGNTYSEADWNTKSTAEDEPYLLSKVRIVTWDVMSCIQFWSWALRQLLPKVRIASAHNLMQG